MTREEAIKELSYIADEMPSMECVDWIKAISMAIKALEQEPCEELDFIQPKKIVGKLISADVLNKIRAEIERRGGNDEKAFCKSLNESYKLGLKEAIDIIDKYKAESEDNNTSCQG